MLLLLYLSCVTTSAAFVAVEFAGRVTGSQMGWRVGQRMIGYFAYEPDRPAGQQTSSRPNLVFETPDQGRFEFTSYNFAVYNNWPADPFATTFWDGFALQFNLCCLPERYGFLSFFSSNTALFPNNQLPQTIPPLEAFDAGRSLTLTYENVQPYQTTVIRIDHLMVVPQPGRPLVHGWEQHQAGISFRFLTEPLTAYTIEFKNRLTDSNWLTLTNIGSAREPIVTIKDAGLQQRFYRLRKQ